MEAGAWGYNCVTPSLGDGLDARLTTLLCKKKILLRNPKNWNPDDLIHDGIAKSGWIFWGRLWPKRDVLATMMTWKFAIRRTIGSSLASPNSYFKAIPRSLSWTTYAAALNSWFRPGKYLSDSTTALTAALTFLSDRLLRHTVLTWLWSYKGKVKLSLCLTNYALRQDDV
jgi:hypothetical protein